MKVRAALAAIVVCTLLVGNVAAADVAGKWTAQVPGRGGQTRETTFNFKADGDKLAGTMSGMQADLPIADGKIAGDAISFTVTISFGDNTIKFLYKGKVEGDEIKFTRQREGADQTQEFTAKRVK